MNARPHRNARSGSRSRLTRIEPTSATRIAISSQSRFHMLDQLFDRSEVRLDLVRLARRLTREEIGPATLQRVTPTKDPDERHHRVRPEERVQITALEGQPVQPGPRPADQHP